MNNKSLLAVMAIGCVAIFSLVAMSHQSKNQEPVPTSMGEGLGGTPVIQHPSSNKLVVSPKLVSSTSSKKSDTKRRGQRSDEKQTKKPASNKKKESNGKVNNDSKKKITKKVKPSKDKNTMSYL